MAGPTALTPAPTVTITAPTPFSIGFPSSPSFDVIEGVPEERKELFRKLSQRRADAHRLIPEFETIREASMARVDAENALKRLMAHPQDFGRNLPETDPLVIAAKKHLEKMTADFERLTELQEVRSAAWQAASAALTACEDFLRYGVPANCQIEAIEVEPPKLAKNEPGLLDAIGNRLRRVRELRADLHRVRSAPYPSSHVKRKMREQVEQLAQRAPDVSVMVEADGDLIWPAVRQQAEVVGGTQRALAFHDAVDVVGLLAFFLTPEVLVKRLDALIDTESDDKAALPAEARQQAEAEIMDHLLSTERDICSLIWRGQAEGLPVEFPADISPLALLGVRLVTTPRRTTRDDAGT